MDVAEWISPIGAALVAPAFGLVLVSVVRLVRVARGGPVPERVLAAIVLASAGEHERRRLGHAMAVRALLGVGVAIPTLAGLLPLVGGLIAALRVVRLFGAVAAIDPASKATMFAVGLAEAWTPLALALVLAGIAEASSALLVAAAERLVRREFLRAGRLAEREALPAPSISTLGWARLAVAANLIVVVPFVTVTAVFVHLAQLRVRVASCSDEALVLLVRHGGRVERRASSGSASSAAAARDAARLLRGDERSVRLEVEDGTTYETIVRVVDALRIVPDREVCFPMAPGVAPIACCQDPASSPDTFPIPRDQETRP